MECQNVPKKYRPIPFWSWNEKLCTAETKAQIHKMDEAGIGGFFMHARGGLQTEYMGEEWFDNVSAAIEAAKETGMRPWAYDENGWPSGFGSGRVNGMGVEYQQKYLRMEDTPVHEETAICKNGSHYFYYDINPFYVDTLDAHVIAEFIKCAYEPYYERYGNAFEGFFTDEPQISRNGIPWSFTFEKEYEARYGEQILEHLEELFLPVGDYKNTRVKFWKMVTDLFSSAFLKQIYDWCEAHNMKLTGHLVLEEKLLCQLASNGACMPHYEYFHIPGMDWLCRNIYQCLTPMQVSSVAEQLGKEAVLSETFALCGHNVSLAELKGIYEWQMVHGINLLCQHLEGYSIRGIRKRDYPPAMYVQQPWWCEYDKFNDSMSRIGMILQSGSHAVDVCVLHPQTTAWSLYDDSKNEGVRELNERLLKVLDTLEKKHIEYHLADETLMERHGKIENGKLCIGTQSYSYVIDPGCELLLDNTRKLLDEFLASGGKLTDADALAENPVIDLDSITYTSRQLESGKVHYFVNTSPDRKQAKIHVSGKQLDIYSGAWSAFDGIHEFEPWGSLMILEEEGAQAAETCPEEKTLIRPYDRAKVVGCSGNTLTLDRCDYYFDGELQEENGYVLNICECANLLERKVQIRQDYHVQADYVPQELYLVCETPWLFEISVNGKLIEQKDTGYFVDKSFRKLDISGLLTKGANVISFVCDFRQSDEFYENLKKARVFESEKNKLAYDMEIEAVYLLGDFSVRTDGNWSELERNGVRYQGGFVLDVPRTEVSLEEIQRQGYPFFCGSLELEGKLRIEGENPVLDIWRRGVNALKVEIAGKEAWMLTDDRLSLKEFGVTGEVDVKFTLINNLRNLLGPHHLKEGECYAVGPGAFFKEPCVWNFNPEPAWDEDYCFVKMSL